MATKRQATFSEFVAGLGFSPTLGQRALIRVAFDGADPHDLTGDEREMARQLFGEVEVVPPLARSVITLVKGRGIGGTMLSAWRMLYLMLTLPFPQLARGEIAFGVGVGPDRATAAQIIRYARGALDTMPALVKRLVSETADGFTLRRSDGKLVAIEVFAAQQGGAAFRGRTIGCLVLTEGAFAGDEGHVVSASDLFAAGRPRLVPGGQAIIESTVWGQEGLLWDLYSANHGNPRTSLAALAPTLLVRDDDDTRAMVEAERERDPDNAAREFDCSWLSGGDACAFVSPDVDRSYETPPGLYIHGRPFLALDPAARNNSFAWLALRWSSPTKERPVRQLASGGLQVPARDEWGRIIREPAAEHPILTIFDAGGWTGEELRTTDMREVARELAHVHEQYGCDAALADQFGDVFLAALLADHGVRLRSFHLSNASKHEAVQLLRQLMRDRQLFIDTDHPQLRRDLLTYPRKVTGSGFKYGGGSKSGHHYDYASALVIAAHSMLDRDKHNPRAERIDVDHAPTAYRNHRVVIPDHR